MNDRPFIIDSLFDGLQAGVCLAIPDQHICYLNPAAAQILGISPRTAVIVSPCDVLCGNLTTREAPRFRDVCPLRQKNANGKAVSIKGRWKFAHGLPRDLRVHCQRLPASWKEPWELDKHLVWIEDADPEFDPERCEQEWRDTIAHDLRGPLTSVYAALQMLKILPADKPPLTSEAATLIESGTRKCQTVLRLLNLYFHLAHSDASQVAVKPTNIKVSDLVGACILLFEAVAKQKNVSLIVHVSQRHRVLADSDLLTQIIANLLDNAIKFSPPGKAVLVKAKRKGNRLVVSIRDHGPGFAPEDLPHIFERHYQGETRNQRGPGSVGLGLSFCKVAIGTMNGVISAESTPGIGSTFILKLPIAP